ncbi:hypothetical protein [Streptomyces sp. NPDC058745]|uniref:hypothetical protein n=1 Tax=Streptomyces sp. NPDC058745 TaxID=3346621 RepID=UPI0036B96786
MHEEPLRDGWCGGDAQGVALAAPYGHALVERGPLGIVQLCGAEEVGDLARHVRTTGSSGAGVAGSAADRSDAAGAARDAGPAIKVEGMSAYVARSQDQSGIEKPRPRHSA